MFVFGYIRVSGLSQVDKDGPERQREAIREFCKAHNLTLVDVFFEAGVSGTKESLDRPAFQDMIHALEICASAGRPVEAVVVENMDRIARDLMVSELIFKECRTFKLKVFSIDQGCVDMAVDAGDPTRKLIRQIFGALAEWNKSMLVQRMHHARMKKKAAGLPFGHARPIGQKPGEPAAIARIQQLYINDKLNLQKVAEQMNAEGFRTRFDRPWNRFSVLRVLERTTDRRGPETEAERKYLLVWEQLSKSNTRFSRLRPHTFRTPKLPGDLNPLNKSKQQIQII